MEEDRTPDLRIANATLSQLSYHPVEGGEFYFRNGPGGNACESAVQKTMLGRITSVYEVVASGASVPVYLLARS